MASPQQLDLELPPPGRPPYPRPFLKWAGGKRQLLTKLLEHMPAKYSTYHEPMMGGGALFFYLRPKRAVLSDTNERLVRTYRAVKYSPRTVIELLRQYPHDKNFFLQMRKMPVDEGTDALVAAWLIYLNKTAFNGLYRVNSRNLFNVPFGNYADPTICDATNLRACSRSLANVDVQLEDFACVLERAARGHLVYFDPPYMPLSSTSSFTAYTKDGFGLEDQRRLRDVALALKKRGAHVILSNSAAPEIYELYAKGFSIHEVKAKRAINSNGAKRGAITELIIT